MVLRIDTGLQNHFFFDAGSFRFYPIIRGEMKTWFIPILLFLFVGILYFCSEGPRDIPPSGLTADQLARQYCGSCHEYTRPEMLTKSIWKEDVLPAMGHRLGIYTGGIRPDSLLEQSGNRGAILEANIFPDRPLLAMEDWNKIVDYYTSHAPEQLLPARDSVQIQSDLRHFTYREAAHSRRPALTTMVKILPARHGIVFADTKPGVNKLVFLNEFLDLKTELSFKTAPIQLDEKSDTLLITTIGTNPFPSDRQDGDLQMVYRSGHSDVYNDSRVIIPDLRRPVQVTYGDLNQDGLEDAVVCEFGNHVGALSLYLQNRDGGYKRQVLKSAPGAIHAEITDLDQDGDADIVALMSQGMEGIYFFQNNGAKDQVHENQLIFSEKQLVSFSPLHGSQYFELHDFNGDGNDDLLYVCGDNADKTPILKNYHGIYIYLNDGNSNFSEAWFYPQNGAYKAIAGDFDLDGDLDIASISFFPDYANNPEESFLYLENTGDLAFKPYSFPQAERGRWMVMDAADMDGDGDLDIALGSFVYFIPKGDTTGLGQRWMEEGPSVVVLENTIR